MTAKIKYQIPFSDTELDVLLELDGLDCLDTVEYDTDKYTEEQKEIIDDWVHENWSSLVVDFKENT